MANSTPQKKIKVPPGYIFIHNKWQGSSLIQGLNRKCRGCCYEDLGLVDFFASSDYPIVFITEADMVSPSLYKEKLKRFSKDYHGKGAVITCRNASSMEYFSDLQKIAVIEYSLTIIPISSTSHMEDTIAQMIKCENRSPHNPFKFKKNKEDVQNEQAQQIAILSTIPGVREAKALRLLKAFGTITALSNASFKELSDVVGNAVAQSIVDFIHK